LDAAACQATVSLPKAASQQAGQVIESKWNAGKENRRPRMTTTEKLSRAERWRVGETSGWFGLFLVPIDGEQWLVELNGIPDWQVLMLACAQRHIAVPLAVLSQARHLFFDDEAVVIQFHPVPPMEQDSHRPQLWQYMDYMPTPYPQEVEK
jgi:hypothetical protein